jgi:hypothetical protein
MKLIIMWMMIALSSRTKMIAGFFFLYIKLLRVLGSLLITPNYDNICKLKFNMLNEQICSFNILNFNLRKYSDLVLEVFQSRPFRT